MSSRSTSRVRVTGDDVGLVKSQTYVLYRTNGTVYTGKRLNLSHSPFFYEIRDVVGAQHSYHPVTHVRYRWKNAGQQPTELLFHTGNPRCVYYPFYIPGGTTTYSGLANSFKPFLGFSRSDTVFAEFADAAVMSAVEQISVELDGLNLLRDFLTLKGLVRQVTGLVSTMWRILSRTSAARRLMAGKSLKEILRLISSGYLINEFGIQPLIREVTSLLSALDRIWKRIEFLRATQGTTFPCRYADEFELVRPDVTGFSDGTQGYPLVPKYNRGYTRIKFNSTIVVFNRLTGLDGVIGELSGFAAGLGFGHLATFAWDLVPFSFVVDWFYQANRRLDRHLSINPFGGSLVVTDCGTSHKWEHTRDCMLTGTALIGEPVVAYISLSGYTRVVGVPARVASFVGSALTSKQWGILTALALQRA